MYTIRKYIVLYIIYMYVYCNVYHINLNLALKIPNALALTSPPGGERGLSTLTEQQHIRPLIASKNKQIPSTSPSRRRLHRLLPPILPSGHTHIHTDSLKIS